MTATVTGESTPAAAFEHSPTRTPVASRTPTPSPTRHFTFPPPGTPLPRGFPCEDASYCTSHFCVDLTCCGEATCPTDQFRNISAHEGSCASRKPITQVCSSNPAACATGFCVDSKCCSTASCPSKERCDIHGYEGNCSARLGEGALCTKNSDCAGGLQCRDLDGNGRQCIAPLQHATPVPTPESTRIAAGAPADGGCAIGKQPATMRAAWLLLGAAVLWGSGRSQRIQA